MAESMIEPTKEAEVVERSKTERVNNLNLRLQCVWRFVISKDL